MALDYCVQTSPSEYLLTEEDKTEFFTDAAVPESALPVEVFRGSAKRHFVDRQPVARDWRLVFVDEGLSSLAPWEKFLKKHRALLQHSPKSLIVFASPEHRRYMAAEGIFRKIITGNDVSGAVDVGRLRSYFATRALFEARDFTLFNQTRLDHLREDRNVFAGEETEALFLEWKRVGEQAFYRLTGRQVRLALHTLQHRYEWLSPIRKEIMDAAHSIAREKGKRGCNRQVG